MSDVSTKVSFFFIKKIKYRHRRHNSAVDDSQRKPTKKIISRVKAAERLQLLICIRRPELCTEAACVTVTACAPLPKTVSMLANTTKGSSTEVKKEGLNIFKY